MSDSSAVVAVINSNPDVVDILRLALERAGLTVASTVHDDSSSDRLKLEDFVRDHDPRVIVYDIAPPYDKNWRRLQDMRGLDIMRDRVFVLTSMNVRHLRELVGADELVFETIGKPMDLDDVVRATQAALRQIGT